MTNIPNASHTDRRNQATVTGADERVKEAAAVPQRGPGVSADERRRLAECCAFFKAARYRPAGPGRIRERDIEAAEADIDAVLRDCGSAERSESDGK